MGETESENDSEAWKKFFRKHWNMVVFFIIGAVLASVGAVFIFLWHVGNAQSTDLVPSTLRLWTMGHLISFILHLVLWELLFIGIPAAIAAIAGWQWWKRIPDDERKEYHFFDKGSRTTSGGGGVSLLHFIVFCIKVYLDGNWDTPFATWTFDYLVYSAIWALIWILIIFGIPIALGLIWWINHEMKHKT
jgi:hypothetical protein